MHRLLLPVLVGCCLAVGFAETCEASHSAGVAVSSAALGQAAPLAFSRGPGYYLSWPKILLAWALFLLWVRTTDWVSVDAQEMRLPFLKWNPIVFGTFMGMYVLAWFLPWFWLAFPLLVVAYVAPLVSYIVFRNQNVRLDQRVLTKAHLRYFFSKHMGKVGVKIEAEKKATWELGPPIQFEAAGGASERDDRAHLLASRQSPGFNDARGVMADALARRASAVMLDYTQENVGVRYMIDGVWHNDEPKEREMCDPVLESLKILAGLNPQDRQTRQQGRFVVNYANVNYRTSILTQGTATGERAVLQIETEKVQYKTLDDLGMRPKMQEQLMALADAKQGFLLLSAMPANGLRSTTNIFLKKTDRFTREFMALEDEAIPYEKIENVPVTTFQVGDNVPEANQVVHVLVKAFRMEPEVIVMRDLPNGDAVNLLCEEVADNRLVISTVRAKDCAEALLRVLALRVPPKTFARSITAVLNQRLIRKLCDKCKEAYAPTPQVLQQLGIPPGRVQAFFRPPTEPEEVCDKCNGIGYHGRTAIFELLVVDDSIRKLLATEAKMEQIRQAARQAGMQNLQAEGVLLVAKGVTSLPELMRVMKQ